MSDLSNLEPFNPKLQNESNNKKTNWLKVSGRESCFLVSSICWRHNKSQRSHSKLYNGITKLHKKQQTKFQNLRGK